MPRLTFILPDGTPRTLEVAEGANAMQAAIGAGLPGIVAECGGNCMCATCHAYADPAWLGALPPMGEDEDALLDGAASERRPESRLCCQIAVTAALDGLTLRLPPRQV